MHSKRAGLIAAIWMSVAGGQAFAQSGSLSSDTKVAIIRFDSGNGTRGYFDAYMKMSYKLIVCDGEVHIAYSLIPESVKSDGRYYLNGKEWKTMAPFPTVSSIPFNSSVGDGVRTIGSVGDKFAGKSLGMGCFSGQTKRVALLREVITLPASNENITYFLNSMALRSGNTETAIFTSTVLTSSLAEQQITASMANRMVKTSASSDTSSSPSVNTVTSDNKNNEASKSETITQYNKQDDRASPSKEGERFLYKTSGTYIQCGSKAAKSPVLFIYASIKDLDIWASGYPYHNPKRNFLNDMARIFWLNAQEDGVKGLSPIVPKFCILADNADDLSSLDKHEAWSEIVGSEWKTVMLRSPGGDLPPIPFKIEIVTP